jgi:pimeloyl-ACP methyl ester carboxylesterase
MTMTDTTSATGPVTVGLVHGAFADGTGWSGVIERLQAANVPVRAIVNPLRGITADSAYVASVFSQVPGRVLAVGHSYGGAIITNAATDAGNVVGLVYVAAFAPDEGEALQDIEAGSTDSVLNAAIRPSNYPTGSAAETAVEFPSTRRRSMTPSPMTFRKRTLPSGPPRKGPSRPPPSVRRTVHPHGKSFPPGQSSRPVIRRPVPMWCFPWPSAPRPRLPKSRDRT